MNKMSLDVALDIIGTMRMLAIKKLNDETDTSDKEGLNDEITMLAYEERIISRLETASDDARLSVMDKIHRIYAPFLKNNYGTA